MTALLWKSVFISNNIDLVEALHLFLGVGSFAPAFHKHLR